MTRFPPLPAPAVRADLHRAQLLSPRGTRCALPRPGPVAFALAAGSDRVPETIAWSAPQGSLTDPEYLRGGLREDVAEEIEECPAGVRGPEPGLSEERAALHLPSFLIHAASQPLLHTRELQPARAGSHLIILPGCSESGPGALRAKRDGENGRGNAEQAGDSGLAGGSWLQPLAHHCSFSSSSMGRRPRRVRELLLREPRDQPRKVVTPICGNVSLIRPPVG